MWGEIDVMTKQTVPDTPSRKVRAVFALTAPDEPLVKGVVREVRIEISTARPLGYALYSTLHCLPSGKISGGYLDKSLPRRGYTVLTPFQYGHTRHVLFADLLFTGQPSTDLDERHRHKALHAGPTPAELALHSMKDSTRG